MKIKSLKKILVLFASITGILALVLAVHIYIVTRPQPPNAHTRAMARVDFKQNITSTDAAKITTWLYAQKGVDHVLCNSKTKIAVFTFFPLQVNANTIVDRMNSALSYKAVRFMPTKKQMAMGCPVAASSLTFKLYNFFKNIF